MSQRRYADDAAKVPIPHCDTLAPLLSMARNLIQNIYSSKTFENLKRKKHGISQSIARTSLHTAPGFYMQRHFDVCRQLPFLDCQGTARDTPLSPAPGGSPSSREVPVVCRWEGLFVVGQASKTCFSIVPVGWAFSKDSQGKGYLCILD